MMKKPIAVQIAFAVAGASLLASCTETNSETLPAASTPVAASSTSKKASPEEAARFVEEAEKQMAELSEHVARVAWVQATYITEDTQALGAKANEEYTKKMVKLANEAKRFNGLDLPYDVQRKLNAIKLGLVLPAPSDEAKTAELSKITSELEATYGKGKYCKGGDEKNCKNLIELSNIIAESRDPEELKDAWVGWRTISPPMRDQYTRMVEIANEGAAELGYDNVGAMWRSNYDMPADDFAAEMDRLWGQVKPLYDSLHCHVRAELNEEYGDEVVPTTGPIPAHLLGNMWSQAWGNIYPLVAPENASPSYSLDERLKAKGYDEIKMVKVAENFFTSLGFEELPQTFWERSLFIKPQDREVQCHASAWDIDNEEDIRIKMCIQVNAEDFQTIHHELGHNIYQRAYKDQPFFYKGSANDGFHEAIGDFVALSITPKYLKDLGLIDQEPSADKDIGLLMRMALDKVAFMPFGLLVDKWRWKVFNGEISPAHYNQGWWDLRTQYQGIVPPVERSESDFDPGAKYHIPANTPYSRYFLAHMLQFQFHREMCKEAGFEGPLHRCSIYGNKEVGEKLDKMLQMGSSRPWPEALEAMTGSKDMDATAVLEYFAPLQKWLDEKNKNRQCGW